MTAVANRPGAGAAATLGRRPWLVVPAPPTRLAAFRILVGGYALVWLGVRLPHLMSFADPDRFGPDRFEGVGVLAPVSGPLAAPVYGTLLAVAVVAAAAVAVGWRHRLSGPAFAAALLAVTTYRNSWGTVLHTEHLLALHALVLAVAPAADAWSLDARRAARTGDVPARHPAAYGWPLRAAALITVLTYVLAGWAKVSTDLAGWLTGDVLRHQIAFDNVRKEVVGDPSSPVGAWAVQHGWLFPPLGALTLVVELGAPLALAGRRLAAWWSAAAWTFHAGIVALMAILFPYPLAGIAFAPLLPLERLGPLVSRLTRRPSPDRAASGRPPPPGRRR